MTYQPPCLHIYPFSLAPNVTPDGVCLTCGAHWSLADLDAYKRHLGMPS